MEYSRNQESDYDYESDQSVSPQPSTVVRHPARLDGFGAGDQGKKKSRACDCTQVQLLTVDIGKWRLIPPSQGEAMMNNVQMFSLLN